MAVSPADAIRCSAIAAAAATFSDSAPSRSGIVTRTSQRSTVASGSPSRSAPRQTVAALSRASSGSPPWATSAARGSGVASIPPRSSGSANTAPMLARTACGP